MAGEYTLQDLLDDERASSGSRSGGGGILETIELLDERGLLEPLLFGTAQGGQGDAAPAPAPAQASEQASTDGGEPAASPAAGLDAAGIKSLLTQVYDLAPELPGLSDDPTVSELIRFVDEHESMVNMLVSKAA